MAPVHAASLGGDGCGRRGEISGARRFLLSESREFTQSFNVAFRVPTGQTEDITHLGANWYLRMGVEVPVTHTKAFDYQVLGALMKVF